MTTEREKALDQEWHGPEGWATFVATLHGYCDGESTAEDVRQAALQIKPLPAPPASQGKAMSRAKDQAQQNAELAYRIANRSARTEAELERLKEQLAKSCLEGRGDPEYPACSRAKEAESELERVKASIPSALHAARLEGAREALHVAFMVGACWCADQKAEAARIVESRWPSTVEKKKEG